MKRLASLLWLLTTVAHAAPSARDVRIDEQVGAQVPLDAVFMTPEGEPTPLRAFTTGAQPTLLVFAYARCKALCSVVLDSATRLMRGLPELEAGRDYRPLVVGLDPTQTLEEARRHRALLRRKNTDALTYLLAKPTQLEALADRVGYRYAWDARTEQYAHPAVLIVLDRHGRVARYLHALGTTPAELETALREANGEGTPTLAGSLAGDILQCFRFDPALRSHREAIQTYFRLGGAVIFAMLASLVVTLLVWERRRRS